MLEVALPGTGGMMPLPNRFLASCYFRINGRCVLIDCGEGTQISLKILGWGFKKLDVICFTHFHADHISGLPGILLTIGNSGRTEPIYIFGPTGINNIIKNLCVIAPDLPFKLIIQELNSQDKISMGDYYLESLSVDHSINCLAYKIMLPRLGKFDLLKAQELNLPRKFWSELQHGKIINYKNKIYTPDMILGPERAGIKISYCTDTRPTDNLIDFIYKSNLFICEGIYGEDFKIKKAIANKHMTFSESATLAKKAHVKELWLTHFSPAMPEPEKFISFAKNIFDNTIISSDRITKQINFE